MAEKYSIFFQTVIVKKLYLYKIPILNALFSTF